MTKPVHVKCNVSHICRHREFSLPSLKMNKRSRTVGTVSDNVLARRYFSQYEIDITKTCPCKK